MMIYYASFIPGLQQIVEGIVRERLPDVRIHKLLDGAVVFESSCTYDKLNFFCFNNIFAVIDYFEQPCPKLSLESYIRKTCMRHLKSAVISENNRKIRSFRIITSMENRPAAVSEGARHDAERLISGQSGLRLDRSAPDTEFWFLCRSEAAPSSKVLFVFMKRLTKHASLEKTLHKGELPPSLAYILCRLSQPKHTDTVMDPFCGYGSIPEQRLRHFPLEKFYAFDIDDTALKYTRKKFSRTSPSKCCIQKTDITAVPSLLQTACLDAIITDPPWGIYGQNIPPIDRFYREMLAVFAGLLKPEGRAVILTARNDSLPEAVKNTGGFEIVKGIPILLSGRKAVIFVLGVCGALPKIV
ncbi:MAG: methyltransferase [Treponema sp.]|jgi:tRNA G10  N-methylase Trm11|nr:methyltransferase [Treponema sp.]